MASIENLDGRAYIDPVEEALRRVSPGKGNPHTTFRSRIRGHLGEAVDEDVAGDLNAPGHRSVVVKAGVVLSRLVGARLEIAGRGVAGATGADVGLQDDAIAFVGFELLLGQIDFDAFGAGCGLGGTGASCVGS